MDDAIDVLAKAEAMECFAKRIKADTETTNAIAIGTLAIKAKIGELLKAPSPKEAGSRKGKKKGFLPDRNPFNKNTRTSFRKLDKHKPRISEYREKVDSHNAEHPNDVLDITTAGFLSYVGSDGERNDKPRCGCRGVLF